MVKTIERIITHKAPNGETITYRGFFIYICIMLTIIVLLLAKELGWLDWI